MNQRRQGGAGVGQEPRGFLGPFLCGDVAKLGHPADSRAFLRQRNQRATDREERAFLADEDIFVILERLEGLGGAIDWTVLLSIDAAVWVAMVKRIMDRRILDFLER